MFLNHDWINIDALCDFLKDSGHESLISQRQRVRIKPEDLDLDISFGTQMPRTRLLYEGGHETTLILDSDDELDCGSQIGEDFDVEQPGALIVPEPSSSQDGSFDWDPDYHVSQSDLNAGISRCSSPTAVDSDSEMEIVGMNELECDGVYSESEMEEAACVSDIDASEGTDDQFANIIQDVGSPDFDAEVDSVDDEMEEEWKDSNTVWLEEGIYSEVLEQRSKVNRVTWVDQVERIHGGIPSNFPIPRVPTAYILDLDDPKYLRGGEVVDLDQLIQDEEKMTRLLNRQSCGGVYICDQTDPKYLGERYELDSEALDELIGSQIQARSQEATTIDKRVLIFFNVINSRHCNAVDNEGAPCTGAPIMKSFREGKLRDGKYHFIACSGWDKEWTKGHRSFSILADVDESALHKLFNAEPLEIIRKKPLGHGCTSDSQDVPLVILKGPGSPGQPQQPWLLHDGLRAVS
ncbi:hypothetical protein K435DRAFT_797857 [Dendrothele bispora CBS 962.96]|uniref:Uncharacterized protein n=1 Tax=Dendrothele bispora (strain CBS 962.96) TaxID=1314807 RepID=A0A4S8M256_DENBC|nr:hypothetical protein K435DRAFT_797857 [Dendrothele bispora CBS 962.96]